MAEIIIKVIATSRLKLAKSTGGSRHEPTSDAGRINHAVEKAARDTSFIDNSVGLLLDFRFPSYKHVIVDYAKQIRTPDDAVALFECIEG